MLLYLAGAGLGGHMVWSLGVSSSLYVQHRVDIYVAAKATYIRLLFYNNNNNNTLIYIAPACRMTSEALRPFLAKGGFFDPSSVKRGRTHIVLG